MEEASCFCFLSLSRSPLVLSFFRAFFCLVCFPGSRKGASQVHEGSRRSRKRARATCGGSGPESEKD